MEIGPEQFGDLVTEALDALPGEMAAVLDNVAVLVDDRHPDDASLLGLYEGVALTERTSDYGGVLPDRITLYRLALVEHCSDLDELRDEVLVTVVHEIAHHVGIDEETLHRHGWG